MQLSFLHISATWKNENLSISLKKKDSVIAIFLIAYSSSKKTKSLQLPRVFFAPDNSFYSPFPFPS